MQVLQPLVSHMTDKPTALEFSIELELEMLIFVEKGKPLQQGQQPTTNSTHLSI